MSIFPVRSYSRLTPTYVSKSKFHESSFIFHANTNSSFTFLKMFLYLQQSHASVQDCKSLDT